MDGDTCTITYLGTGLAEGEPTSKSVMAIGHIDPEFSGEAFFSFVEFRVDGI